MVVVRYDRHILDDDGDPSMISHGGCEGVMPYEHWVVRRAA